MTQVFNNPFVLLMPWGRVGSNVITSALNSNKKSFKMMNEPATAIQSKGAAAGKSPGEIKAEQQDHLVEFMSGREDDPRHFGLKLAFNSIVDPKAYLDKLREIDTRLVLMVRHNFLKCGISMQRAMMLKTQAGPAGKWKSGWAVRKNEPKPEAMELNIADTIKSTRKFEDLHFQMMGRVHSIFGQDFLYMTYEELMPDPGAAVLRIADYIGAADVVGEPKINQKKATSDDLRDDVLNYDDLVEALRHEGLERYL